MSGKELELLRINLEKTQKQFADMLGVANTAVSQWETGERIIPRYIMKSAESIAIINDIPDCRWRERVII